MDLDQVASNATYLCFNINSFSGQELNDVSGAKCRLYNTATKEELATFNLTTDKRLDCTALLMAVIYRAEGSNGEREWYMHAVGEGANGRTVQDNVDEWQAFLRRTPLASLHSGRDAPVDKIVKLKVPEKVGPSKSIGFKTPSGGTQEVKIPPSAYSGDIVEIPMVDIYVK